jgi:hypothetical protein
MWGRVVWQKFTSILKEHKGLVLAGYLLGLPMSPEGGGIIFC